jgi:hypothetical protein
MSKAIKVAGIGLIAIFFVLSMSCSSSKKSKENHSKEYTSDYICPMHCEGSGSDKAGQCPDCGMDYVKNIKNNKKQ